MAANRTAIIFLGSQGSGKGTQAKILSKKLNCPEIGMGDLLRKEKEMGTPLGKAISKDIEEGILVQNVIVCQVLQTALDQYPDANIIIFDGVPRTLEQKESFDEILTNYNFSNEYILFLDLNDEIAMSRLLHRGRRDDKDDVIQKRLTLFHKETDPVMRAYDQEHRLYHIDGTKSVDEISDQIDKCVGGILHHA